MNLAVSQFCANCVGAARCAPHNEVNVLCIRPLCDHPAASSPAPGSSAAGRVAWERSGGPSHARCCCPSPRPSSTCPMTTARGTDLSRSSRASTNPAWEDRAMEAKVKRRRPRHREGTSMTGSTKGLRSARRAAVEV